MSQQGNRTLGGGSSQQQHQGGAAEFSSVVMLDIPQNKHVAEAAGGGDNDEHSVSARQGGGSSNTPRVRGAHELHLFDEPPLLLDESSDSGFAKAGVVELHVLVNEAVGILNAQDMGRAEEIDFVRLEGLDTMIGMVIESASSCPVAFNPPIAGDLELLKNEWSQFSGHEKLKKQQQKNKVEKDHSGGKGSRRASQVNAAFVMSDSSLFGGRNRDTTQLVSHAEHLKSFGTILKTETPASNSVKNFFADNGGLSLLWVIFALGLYGVLGYLYYKAGGPMWLAALLAGAGWIIQCLTTFAHMVTLSRLKWTRNSLQYCFHSLGQLILLSKGVANKDRSNSQGSIGIAGNYTASAVANKNSAVTSVFTMPTIQNPLLGPDDNDGGGGAGALGQVVQSFDIPDSPDSPATHRRKSTHRPGTAPHVTINNDPHPMGVPQEQSPDHYPLGSSDNNSNNPAGSTNLAIPRSNTLGVDQYKNNMRKNSFSMTLAPSVKSSSGGPQTVAFTTPSESMDPQQDNITLIVPGVPEGVNLDVKSIHQRVMMIVTDNDDNVLYWNQGAQMVTGFSNDDVLGRSMQNFVADGSSDQILQRMKVAATSTSSLNPRTISLVSASFGTVSVRGTMTAATLNVPGSNNKVVGHALVASEIEDSTWRTQTMLHNFALSELAKEVDTLTQIVKNLANTLKTTAAPQNKIEESKIGLLQTNRSAALLEKLKWSNMNTAASAVIEWGNVTIQSILEGTLRNRHQFIDILINNNVPNNFICDGFVVGPALSKLMSGVSGKSRLEITCREIKHGVSQINILIMLKDKQHFDSARVHAANTALLTVCGDCAEFSAGVVLFTFPFLTDENIVGVGMGQSLSGHSSSSPSFGPSKTDFPVTVLLVEKSPVFRQNIILALLPMGHSFSWAESATKALRSLESNGNDYAAIILDVDQGQEDVVSVLDYVSTHCPHMMIIVSSERPNMEDSVKDGRLFLHKPINRSIVEAYMESVAKKAKERKEKEEYEKKQREVLGTVRTIPWKKGRALGTGAFANVYEATATMTGARMAVKMIRVKDQTEETVDRLVNEVRILCKLSHPNIIHYLYCEMGDNTLNLFMELAQNGSLADQIRKTGGSPMSETQLARYTKQFLQAVAYLHEQGIVHRDLKPANMLLTENNVLKVTDFGTATEKKGELNDTEGTIYYMAPEVIEGKAYGKPCDIWSVGCVMCEMLGVERNPLQQPVPSESQFPSSLSRVARQFISLCMKVNPEERPSAGTLLLHEFIVEHAIGASMSLGRNPSKSGDHMKSGGRGGTGGGAGSAGMDQWTVGGSDHQDSGSGGSDSTPSW